MHKVLFFIAAACMAQQRPVEEFQTRKGTVKITPIRHATAMVEAGGKVLYIDPWSQANFEGLPKADYILITDIHGDHMDPKAVDAIRKPNTVIVGPAAVAEKMPQVQTLANGASKEVGPFRVEAVAMYNLKRGPSEGKLFHDKGRGNGYVINYGVSRFYFSGDTEATPEMRDLKNIDVAFVCMNLPYTMTPEEAADGVRAFHPKIVYPYHYRDSDINLFESKLNGSGIEVRKRNWYY